MANIKVTLDYPIIDGQAVTFKAPCDCTAVTGVKIYYPNGESTASKVFTFEDAHGNDLTGVSNLFVSGSYVKLVVNTTDNVAYIQNADTNSYLEGKFDELQTVANNAASAAATAQNTANGKANASHAHAISEVTNLQATLNSMTSATSTAQTTANNAATAAANAQTTANGKAPMYSYGTNDLTAGTSSLETGKLHFVYE